MTTLLGWISGYIGFVLDWLDGLPPGRQALATGLVLSVICTGAAGLWFIVKKLIDRFKPTDGDTAARAAATKNQESVVADIPAKSMPTIVLEQLNAQSEIDQVAPQLQAALEMRVEHLTAALKRRGYVKAIKDLRARASEIDRAHVRDAGEINDWVRITEPLVEKFLDASRRIRDCYRAYHDWYRLKPDQWAKSTLPERRDQIVASLRFARSMTDIVIGIREAAIGPRHNHPELDAATARLVMLLDKLAESFRSTEEKAQELLSFMDGDGALMRHSGETLEGKRAEAVRRIIRDGAAYVRSGDMSLETGDGGFGRLRLDEFLGEALRAGLCSETDGVRRDLMQKNISAAERREEFARHLEGLANRLTPELLHPNYEPPQSFGDILKPR